MVYSTEQLDRISELANVGSPLAVSLTNGYLLNMDADEDL